MEADESQSFQRAIYTRALTIVCPVFEIAKADLVQT